jgi:hypothetical protein
MSPRLRIPSFVALFGLSSLLLGGGCSNLMTTGALRFLSAPNAKAEVLPTESCSVEVHGEYGKPRKFTMPVSADTRAQNIVEAAGVRYRRMNVFILRPAPRNPDQTVKLVCHYDPAEHSITYDTDYAVLAGDRVIIQQDSSTVVDDLVEGVLGPVLTSRRKR